VSGQHSRYQFLLRQRLTANGLNAQADYTARLSYAALQALVAADGQHASGVLDGLLCTVQAGTLNVAVGGGLALLYDAGLGLPDATHRWIEVPHSAPITVTLDPGDVLARWDLIEIEPQQIDGPPEVLDFYDPSLGAAVPFAAAPVKVCSPLVTVTKGTPSASAQFPAGTAGRIPLAYVYVPAGAVALAEIDIAYCRPIRKPRAFTLTPTTIDLPHRWQIEGGGLQVSVAGLEARLVNEMSGHFPGASTPFSLTKNQVCRLSVTNHDGGGLPGSSSQVYAYAIPWPFPAGSDPTLAPREFYLRNPSRLTSGGYAVGQTGCMIVWSAIAPEVTMQGAASAGGNGSFNHPNIGVFTVPYEDMVYVGSAFFDQPTSQFILQRGYNDIIGAERKSGAAFDTLLPIAAPVALPINVNTAFDPEYALPAHVRHVRMVSWYQVGGGSWIYVAYSDQFETAGGNQPSFIYHEERNAAAPSTNIGDDRWLHLTDSQEIVITEADAGVFGNCVAYVYEYKDPVIAMR
jgi:hypothetical protein